MKKILMLAAALAVAAALTGCSALEQLQEWKNGGDAPAPTAAAAADDQLVVALEEPAVNSADSREVVLFFADGQGQQLQKELRRIVKTEGLAKSTLEELLKGPSDNTLAAALPAGTRLLSLNIKEGLATADFSGELRQAGGATGELLAVYAIVNTLTQFNSVERVQLLIEGAPAETLAGHVDISAPLTRDISLVGE